MAKTPPITSVINDNLYPLVASSFDKSNTLTKYKKVVQNFMEARHAYLYDTGPNDRIFFGQDDKNVFFSAIGFTEEQARQIISKGYFYDIPFSPIAIKDPFTDTVLMLIKYFIKKKMQKEKELTGIYLAFSGKFYPSIHYNSFPDVVPSEHREVMDYVVNNVLTQKYDLKVYGSVFGAVRSIVITWLDTYEKDKMFDNPNDEDVAYLIQQLRNRIKSFIINIARLYYDAYKNKDYLNFESDINDENDFRLVENNAMLASRYTEASIQYMTTGNINYKFCTMAADQNVKVDEVKSIMTAILAEQKSITEMKELIDLLIVTYMVVSHDTSLDTTAFMAYSLKAKPNTKSPELVRIKEIVENWLNENSPNYRRRKSREETKNSYHKAVLEYTVLCINEATKSMR